MVDRCLVYKDLSIPPNYKSPTDLQTSGASCQVGRYQLFQRRGTLWAQ